MKNKNYLLETLLDKSVDAGARDDCAMDLADYDGADVLKFLNVVGSDKSEDWVLQSSCGESIAEIMVRTNRLNKEYLTGLSEHALAQFMGYIKAHKSEWLHEL